MECLDDIIEACDDRKIEFYMFSFGWNYMKIQSEETMY